MILILKHNTCMTVCNMQFSGICKLRMNLNIVTIKANLELLTFVFLKWSTFVGSAFTNVNTRWHKNLKVELMSIVLELTMC